MNPFIGEIKMFGGNFAPRGWAFCDGQLQAISSNTALFSILGTTYGGDGRTTFALPDLRGRVAMHAGRGPGLTDRRLGASFGTETNTLTLAQLPSHNHTASGTLKAVGTSLANERVPGGFNLAGNQTNEQFSNAGADTNMAANNVSVSLLNTGGSQPTNNIQPVEVVNYIISLFGVYPSRS